MSDVPTASKSEVFVKPRHGEISLARWMLDMTDHFQKLAESNGIRAEDCWESNFIDDCKSFRTIALVYAKEDPSGDAAGPVLVWHVPISLGGGWDNNHLELTFGIFSIQRLIKPGEEDQFGRVPLRFAEPNQPADVDTNELVTVQFWPDVEVGNRDAYLEWKYVPGSELSKFVRSNADILPAKMLKGCDSAEGDIRCVSADEGWKLVERLIRLYVRCAEGVPAVPAKLRQPAKRKKR